MTRDCPRRECFVPWLVVALVASAMATDTALGGESLAERFLSEAPQQWAEYCRLARTLQGTVRFTVRDCRADGKLIEEYDFSIILNGDSALFHSRPAGAKQRAAGVNSEYAFEIESKSGAVWTLSDLYPYPKADTAPDFIGGQGPAGGKGPHDKALRHACRGLVIWGTWFPRVVTSGCFTVEQVTSVPGKEEGLVQVVFRYEPTRANPQDHVRSGTVVLQSKRYWLIREAKVEGSWVDGRERGTMTVANEYAEGKGTIPVLKRQVMHVSSPGLDGGRPVEHDWLYDLDLRQSSAADESRFTLSAFGLPEPAPEPERHFPVEWILLALVMLVLLAGGSGLIGRKASGGAF